jgi:hypothetical protein
MMWFFVALWLARQTATVTGSGVDHATAEVVLQGTLVSGEHITVVPSKPALVTPRAVPVKTAPKKKPRKKTDKTK